MSSTNKTISAEDRQTLLALARHSIEHGLNKGRALPVNASDYPESLQPVRATFITLEKHAQLRGCIGTLEASQPLVLDVVYHAHAAAFEDPRFPPLQESELIDLDIHISVLSPPAPIDFESEQDLLNQLRPGVDGLILRYGHKRATFLPSVWEDLSEPHEFLDHLKRKANLAVDFWSDAIEAHRYTTESF